MPYSDDAYAAMLLTLRLSPDREEYARPLSTQEFNQLEALVRSSALNAPGRLLGMDISGLMQTLDMQEEDAYRVFTLLNRSVQLTYAIEAFEYQGIEIITRYDNRYPARLKQKLGSSAPPAFYFAGNEALLCAPTIAICGISGVKTTPAARAAVEKLVSEAESLGYIIGTGGELGVSHLALNQTLLGHGCVLDVLGGALNEHIQSKAFGPLLDQGRAAAISLEHPQALFTISHAIQRNKLLFALSDAVFVLNTDGKRGETDGIRQRLCDVFYAWVGHPSTEALIAKGAIPMRSLEDLNLSSLKEQWLSSRIEQIDMFEYLNPQKKQGDF